MNQKTIKWFVEALRISLAIQYFGKDIVAPSVIDDLMSRGADEIRRYTSKAPEIAAEEGAEAKKRIEGENSEPEN